MPSKLKVDQLETTGGAGNLESLNNLKIYGNLDYTGALTNNGVPFTTLPTQTDATRGTYLVSDGSNGAFWAYPGGPSGTSSTFTGYRYRTIFTHGFLAGGYKGSQPWRSVNKTWHNTDVTIYCGEQLDRAAAYLDGTFSDYNGYVHGTVDSFSGSSSHTSSYNLHNGVMRQRGDGTFSPHTYGYDGDNPNAVMGYGTAGGWDMSVARDYHSCATDMVNGAGYTTGGGSSATDKMHFATEIMYTTTGSPSAASMTSGCGQEFRGWFSIAGTNCYITFANDTWTSQSFCGGDGWSKFLPSKWGFFYAGTGANVTTPIRKVNGITGANLADFSKVRAVGEENYQMGQDWGYMLGNYDNQQNNHSVKFTYATDVQTTMGAATRPKGHYGQSSGACSSAAATVTATRTL
jgi:hypothetical protein